ncbi:MAG: hypothetical protein ACK55Z_20660, partial [bacterium]
MGQGNGGAGDQKSVGSLNMNPPQVASGKGWALKWIKDETQKGQCSCYCRGPVPGAPPPTTPPPVPKGKTLLYTNTPISVEMTKTVIKAMVRAEGLQDSAVHT